MSEKITDTLMLGYYKRIFGNYYHTENNKLFFKNKIPDGWDVMVDNNNKPMMLIIENKNDKSQLQQGLKQLYNYYEIVPDDIKQNYKIYLILGCRDNEQLIYFIFDNNKRRLKITLTDIHKQVKKHNIITVSEIHKINQYIYNNIKLDRQHKTLFISSILLCLKINPCFIFDFKNINNKSFIITNYILTIIKNYYNDPVLTDTFKFINKANINDEILYTIIEKLYNIIKNDNTDILNKFYSEFCVWDKNDDKNNGIVLTPSDIVELMIKELNIQSTDKVLDFATGTGSFLTEASKYTNNIYGCECSLERYTLAKTNFILNNIDYSNLKYNSCFNEKYISNDYDKIIINPPFAMDCSDDGNNENNICKWTEFNKEQRFIMYAIELLRSNGFACIIVPRSNFMEHSVNQKSKNIFKKQLLTYCDIIKIINLNSKVFYPVASVECAIIIIKKLSTPREITEPNTFNIITVDYTDDGYDIAKNKRIYKKEPSFDTKNKYITYLSNWNYEKEVDKIDIDELKYNIRRYNIEYKYNMLLKELEIDRINGTIPDVDNINIWDWKTYKLNDIITIIKPIKTYKINEINDGNIPLISSKSSQNGVTKYVNDYSIDIDHEYMTINRNGSVGYVFVQCGKIAITQDVLICDVINKDINIHLLSVLLTNKLTKIYSYSNKLTIEKLKNESIMYPTNEHKFELSTFDNNKKWKEYNLNDILLRVQPLKKFKINSSVNGNIPLITRNSKNNGISKYINDYSFDPSDNERLITIAPSGSTGYCFYHPYKFAIDGNILVYNILDKNINPHLLAILITNKFTQKYNYNNGLTNDKILNETILYPIG